MVMVLWLPFYLEDSEIRVPYFNVETVCELKVEEAYIKSQETQKEAYIKS